MRDTAPSKAAPEKLASTDMRLLDEARMFAAEILGAASRPELAEMVKQGQGDDFAEVQAALSLLQRMAKRMDRQEEALRVYADADFWDDDGLTGGSLAFHDQGEIARNVLIGRPPFFHRD